MATAAQIQAQIDALNDKISKINPMSMGGLSDITVAKQNIAKLQPQLMAAQQAEQQQQEQQTQQQQPQPQQQATPISQVAPQPAAPAAAPFALQGGNQAFFSNIDPKTGLPIVKQSAIDDQLKKYGTNELTANNSNIRDAIYGSGWNAKSDAVQVLNGAAIYGLAKPINAGVMGNPAYQKPNGASVTDADFINAAKAAGIDPNQYMTTSSQMGVTTNKVNRDALYNAINDKSKDLYQITNAIGSTGGRGSTDPHATILFKADGNGNLVAAANPQTGQPAIKYENAVSYNNDPGFLSDFGPLLGMAGLAFGIPALSDFLGAAAPAAEAAAGGMVSAGALPGVVGGFGALGPEAIAAYTGAPLTAALDYGQVAADTAAAGGYSDVVPASELGSQQFPQTINAIGEAGATAPTVPPLTAAQKLMQAIGVGGNNQSALGNLINPSGSSDTAVNTALANAGLTSLIGSGGQAISSYLSGQAQADAAKQAAANQMAMFNTINNQLAPQRGAGYQSLNQIRSMLPGQFMSYNELGQPAGIATGTDYLTRQFSPQDLQAGLAPNYNFMLQQGQQANQRAANVGGGLIGGNALQGLENYTQGNAQNAYQQAFNNFNTQRTGIYNTLAGIAGLGQQATNTGAQVGQNAVTAQGQLGVGAAAAQAAGTTGAANAVQGGLQNYQQNQLLQAILAQNQNVAQKPA